MSLVILLLFANKEEANLRIVDHILNLLLAAVGIERYRGNSDTIRTEVGVQVMYTVLREDSDFVEWFSPKIEKGVAHLFHSQREKVKRNRLPLVTTKLSESKRRLLSPLLSEVMNQD